MLTQHNLFTLLHPPIFRVNAEYLRIPIMPLRTRCAAISLISRSDPAMSKDGVQDVSLGGFEPPTLCASKALRAALALPFGATDS